MIDKVAAVIVNYNMPERTDAICAHLQEYAGWPLDLIVVDNGSDLVAPSQFTTLKLPANRQTTGGWLAGLEQARKLGEHLAYWFLITSAEFVEQTDPLTPLASFLLDTPQAVAVHPALTRDSTTAWGHLKKRSQGIPRRTWMIDNIASLWRADWFDECGGFDPCLKYGWGIDLETCWKARRDGRSLWVHEGVRVKKVTDIGYMMERMNMSAELRRVLAGANMTEMLSERYGPDWWGRMRTEFVQEDWL